MNRYHKVGRADRRSWWKAAPPNEFGGGTPGVLGRMSGVMVLALFATAVHAQSLKITDTHPFEGTKGLEWGPPLGWSSNTGDICGDKNDEDAGLAIIHVGVPKETKTVEFLGAVDVSGLDKTLQLVPGLFTLDRSFIRIGIAQTTAFPGGREGYQTFKLQGTVTAEDNTWFLIPIFKVRVIGKPDNSFAGNDDSTSVVFIDGVKLTFNDDGKNRLSNGGFEAGDLSESFSAFLNRNAWFPPNCVAGAATENAAAQAQSSGDYDLEAAMVPMQDGTRLATDVYRPKGNDSPLPAVVVRTPYGRRMPDLGKGFVARGIALVAQDLRGRGDSEGEDRAFEDDGWGKNRDGADTIAWVKRQPWCNGKIGTWGNSALGVTQVLLAPVAPDVTAQAIIMAPSTFYGQFIYQGGVYRKQLVETWTELQRNWDIRKTWQSHPFYDDYWEKLDGQSKVGEVHAAGTHMGGWFDIGSQGTIDYFSGRQQEGGESAKGRQQLIMGPWVHGISQTVGDLTFPDNYNFDFLAHDFGYFEHWLLGKENGIADEPAVRYYTMGACGETDAPGNEWHTADAWPPFPTDDTPFYLHRDGRLSREPEAQEGRQRFTYDPNDPCPTVGGAVHFMPAGPRDQRSVSERPDVLRFETAPLDAPIEVTGRVRARLFVSTDGPDTDFTAKLLDIYPDGREILILDGIRRLKFRKGYETPEPLPAGEVGEIEIDLWSTSLIFNKGHRIGVQVSSSNYPRFEVNPNTGQDFPQYREDPDTGESRMKPDSVRTAQNTVYTGGNASSALILPLRRP